MPQVTPLAIDISPSKDFSPVQSGAISTSKNSTKDFAQMVDQHYQSQQSGKKQQASGNNMKLASEINAEKKVPQEKSSTTDVQPKEKQMGGVSDEKVNTEINQSEASERLPYDDTATSEKNVRVENSQEETPEHKASGLINLDTNSTAPENTDKSTEQLMSLLSASQQLLNDTVKNDGAIPSQLNEKPSIVVAGSHQQEKTQLAAMLRQVLGGNSQENVATSDNTLAKDSLAPELAKSLTVPVTVNSEMPAKKVDLASEPKVVADKVVQGEAELALSALLEKKTNSEGQDPSLKTTNVNGQLSTQSVPPAQSETSLKAEPIVDKTNNVPKQAMPLSDLEALLADMEKAPTDTELEQIKAALIANQDKAIIPDKSNQSISNSKTSVDKELAGAVLPVTLKNESLVNEIAIDADKVNTDNVVFSSVAVPGEKQAQENNANNSRGVNQINQKTLETQNLNAGEQFKEPAKDQSAEQQNQKQAQSLTQLDKVANNDAQVKEKTINEIFDKKQVSTSIENTLNRDMHRANNEVTKSTASAEEMITKLTSDHVQSTAQSATNAKQVTALQNEALSVYRKDFTGALNDKVMVMMNQKLQQVEIRLDPQELGNVNVKINLQNEQAVVNFTVQNQQAKEAFDQNLGRLKEMLAESGVNVGDANVEQQSKQNNNEEELGEGRQGGGDGNENEFSDLSDTQTLHLVKGSSTGIDYYA
ncbi:MULTISPECIES: flagellar hook-length control protein FliK [unclassified Colwellia]|uniref:flagellar hook-length control protein FliK n=1 Tax=unclassified Colwellia TaxID=196834 RepID=UPI0015F73F15|nr:MULTISPECIES: flagellar hook-length control protein FliK [unclassified Colwellia]MBA6354518.1 flagellar hook-length control protein FliK [Colwellia sp. BRX8-3]MBA6358215.1 flagellar hook-length control protein FliK [Colwellia sp. BRX8-6]MBA6366032.1 flagellar hook-length control protein FliK [Colwellia sp. BRX8-5]MBA6374460.1 flagellar hook-length control protein FliK [Colwellia sp. BRX8-2]